MNDDLPAKSELPEETVTNDSGKVDPAATRTSAHQPVPDKELDGSIPQRIGPFTIRSRIGEGGMGTVYEAEQDSPKRTVALKVIRRGLGSSGLLKRFVLESQVLGRLQHPGIAQVYQAGTADTDAGPVPYFAMEFVRGVDLRQYVRQNNLDVRKRLYLLAQICDAVHHAHQKGVIHRDLKPGNILVDQTGQPKVLDFGVARATDSDMQVTTMQTDVGQLIGTLQYMSPEQVAANPGELDTRSDVYALGVITYEILTGQLPYELKNKMIHEVARIIQEEEPSSPGATNRTFRGDIETIVAKALDKDKTRRYQSAAGLADDIRRYLADEPIQARPASALYQLQKFAKRNRALAGGITVAMAAMFVGLVISTFLYLQTENARLGEMEQRLLAQQKETEAIDARAEAQQKTEELRTVTEFQQSMLSQINPESMGQGILEAQREDLKKQLQRNAASEDDQQTVLASFDSLTKSINATNLALRVVDRHVLTQAIETIDQEFPSDPVIRAALLQTVASTYRSLGLLQESLPLQEQALELREAELGEEHPDTLTSLHQMGLLLRTMRSPSEGEPYLVRALAGRRKVLGNDHEDTLVSISDLAELIYWQGRHQESLTLNREANEGSIRVHGEDSANTRTTMNNLAITLQSFGRHDEAEDLLRRVLEGQRKAMGAEHPLTLIAQFNVGFVHHNKGEFEQALGYYKKTLEAQRRVLGDTHPNTLFTANAVGLMLSKLGRSDEAITFYQESVDGYRKIVGFKHKDTLTAINNLGAELRETGQYEEALELLTEAEPSARSFWETSDQGMLGLFLAKLADTKTGLNDFEEAEKNFLESHKLLKSGFGLHHKRTHESKSYIARFYASWHKADPRKGNDIKAKEWRSRASSRGKKQGN